MRPNRRPRRRYADELLAGTGEASRDAALRSAKYKRRARLAKLEWPAGLAELESAALEQESAGLPKLEGSTATKRERPTGLAKLEWPAAEERAGAAA